MIGRWGCFILFLVYAVLLCGSETWVMSPRIGKTLGGFHHQAVGILMRWQLKRRLDGTWYYPPLLEAMVKLGI